MHKPILAIGCVISTIMPALPGQLDAAELPTPSTVGHAHIRAASYCEPCGCLSVVYVYHRELRSTYGLSFDPRNYDATAPHFYFGRMRAYPQYFVDGLPLSGSCH